eukprot:snap_masked-scaffold_26-processed-gene-0.44-mRNA-1 protein AED:1.00 eAED:1.00 QI:0/0/0/0/1/1/2/0/65
MDSPSHQGFMGKDWLRGVLEIQVFSAMERKRAGGWFSGFNSYMTQERALDHLCPPCKTEEFPTSK